MEIVKDFTHGGNVHKAAEDNGIPKHKLLDFSANINPLGMSPKGLRAIKTGLKNVLNYPDPEYRELKNTLANYYNVKKEYLVPGNGAIELIYSYAKNREIGKALIPAPGFVEYEKALLRCGWDVFFYTDKNEINTDGVDVVFICNPNNPTGGSYSSSFLSGLLARCKTTHTELFLDEAFTEYSSYKTMTPFLEHNSHLFILKSLTKFFAIPGLRLGALLTSNSLFKENSQSEVIPWSINSVAGDYIEAASLDKKYITQSKRYMRKERVWLYKELNNINGIKALRSQGNYILFKVEIDVDLCAELVKNRILIRNCGNYNNLDSTYYRVAIKKHRENILLLKSLKMVLN